MDKSKSSHSRRGFIKGIFVFLSSVFVFKPADLFAVKLNPFKRKAKFKGKVALVKDKGYSKNYEIKRRMNSAAQMLKGSLLKITGSKSENQAWEAVAKRGDKVGIKLNCLAAPHLSPSKELVFAITDGLVLAGVAKNDIIIWERSERELLRAGFAINTSSKGIRVMGTDSLKVPYDNKIRTSGSIGSLFSNVVVSMCDTLINVGVLKDHYLCGVGAGMKNFYGAIHNPNKYHDNNCDPYVGDLCNHPLIKNKLRLTVIDALICQWEGGPGYIPDYSKEYNSIILGFDPVAVDRVAFDIIDSERKKNGLKSLKEVKRYPQFIFSADKLGLGESDLGKINIFKTFKS